MFYNDIVSWVNPRLSSLPINLTPDYKWSSFSPQRKERKIVYLQVIMLTSWPWPSCLRIDHRIKEVIAKSVRSCQAVCSDGVNSVYTGKSTEQARLRLSPLCTWMFRTENEQFIHMKWFHFFLHTARAIDVLSDILFAFLLIFVTDAVSGEFY